MKILFITPKIPYPPIDGHKKSMWGIIKYLSMRGHEIKIVCYSQNESFDSIKTEVMKYAGCKVLDVQTKNSITSAFKNIFSSVPYNLYKYQRNELSKYLSEHLQIEKYDLVHITNSHMGWVIDIIKKYSAAPVVLRQENLELMIMKRYYENQKNILLKMYALIQYKKFDKYEPSLCSKYDLCIMMSERDEINLKSLNKNINTIVIPLGVEKELLEQKRSEVEPLSLVHIGSLNWYPNLDGLNWFIQEIYPIVLKVYPKTKLYLYGGGIPVNYSFPTSVNENVIVKGFVGDIWDELKDKALAIIPLRIGSGIRVKILEMLAAGQNVITTSLGKEGIELRDSEEILIADTPGDFAEKIINFFGNYYDSKQISSKGRKFIESNYLWENIAQKFEQTYLDLINN